MPLACHSLLPSPEELITTYPCPENVSVFQETCRKILRGDDSRIALILGPCSIHDVDEALEYGAKVAELQKKIDTKAFLIMRVFLEKPRTRLGWKGLLYDPHLDGSNDLAEGLRRARKLFYELNSRGVPCGTEFLDPIVATYFSDLISWGLIGARTSSSQPHRQFASGLSVPVGFKNSVQGDLEPALSGIISSQTPHTHFSLNPDGRLCSRQTEGNPFSHLVLRGSETEPNCDPESVSKAMNQLIDQQLENRLIIDCAHGNSGKDLKRQRLAFKQCMEQIRAGNREIRALMIESSLKAGKQALTQNPPLYGVSITDPCLGWEETEELILQSLIDFN